MHKNKKKNSYGPTSCTNISSHSFPFKQQLFHEHFLVIVSNNNDEMYTQQLLSGSAIMLLLFIGRHLDQVASHSGPLQHRPPPLRPSPLRPPSTPAHSHNITPATPAPSHKATRATPAPSIDTCLHTGRNT